MGQAVLRAEGLPSEPLDAAVAFYRGCLPLARAAIADGQDLALIFAPARPEHRAWRLAAVQELAREAVPFRVNALVGTDEHALHAMLDWLAQAEAITGQLLTVDGKSGETR